jgi:SAM-dependent methyltransferase
MSNRQVRDRRFRFGDNWLDFARTLGPDQLTEAERSLRRLLECDSLAGLSFLDIGSGSGLFSLAARKLGARVHSFDFDEESVFCTTQLRERYFAGDRDWTIEQGSILDDRYVRRLGTFDVVYAWGVLHHTGAMHDALAAATRLVGPGGLFGFALYHRTLMCRLWRWEKRWYSGASPQAQSGARVRSTSRYCGRRSLSSAATFDLTSPTTMASAEWTSRMTCTIGWAAIPMSRFWRRK